jgi:hypothetical protein
MLRHGGVIIFLTDLRRSILRTRSVWSAVRELFVVTAQACADGAFEVSTRLKFIQHARRVLEHCEAKKMRML